MRVSRLLYKVCLLGLPAVASAGSAEQIIFHDVGSRPVKNVAIIGAGSAGSSAAYYLRKYSEEAGFALNITVYERESYIGGRSTTVNVYDDPLEPVELGASIFVEVNQNLVKAAKKFNLSTDGMTGASTTSDAPILGIWNSKEFVFTQAPGGRSWWDNAKLLWKYGLAPIKTVRLMKSTVGKFLKMYEEPYFPWKSLSDVVYEVGLTTATAATGEQFLKESSIGDLFANEVIQASTRVNYAQNLPLIHGLETMVCMAAEGAMAIEGGNWQIFAHMLESSHANIQLARQVTKLEKSKPGGYHITSSHFSGNTTSTSAEAMTVDNEQQSQVYDEVILAAPNQFSNIEFIPPPRHVPDEIPYVQLHVTLFTSKHKLAPAAFNLAPDQQVPQIILTTLPPGEQHGSNRNGVGSPGFFSISTLRPTMDTREGKRKRLEYLYKVFSPDPLTPEFLAKVLGVETVVEPNNDDSPSSSSFSAAAAATAASTDIDQEDISWIYRKIWHSYPYEYPRVTFEELRLDEKLWYTSGIEGFISTMETSSLMGMNVAKLMAEEWVRSNASETSLP